MQKDKAELQQIVQRPDRVRVRTDDLEILDRVELEKRLLMAVQAYEIETGRRKELEEKMRDVHGKLLRLKGVERQYKALEEAHVAQAEFIQKMQQEVAKVSILLRILEPQIDKYRVTTRNQEEVIEKLEEMMQGALMEAKRSKSLEAEREALMEDLRKETEEKESLRKQVETMEAHIVEMQKKFEDDMKRLEVAEETFNLIIPQANPPPASNAAGAAATTKAKPGDWEKERLMLTLRTEKAETRAKSMEKQMNDNNKKFAREIAELKTKLLNAGTE